MKYFILDRVVPTIDGTIGRMGRWYSFEEEDQKNQRNISSILAGAYLCRRVQSPKFGDTFEVTGVPNRSHILFHPLNSEEDTDGCIGLGLSVGFMDRVDEDSGEKIRKLSIRDSRIAHEQFKADLAGINEFILVIRDYRGA